MRHPQEHPTMWTVMYVLAGLYRRFETLDEAESERKRYYATLKEELGSDIFEKKAVAEIIPPSNVVNYDKKNKSRDNWTYTRSGFIFCLNKEGGNNCFERVDDGYGAFSESDARLIAAAPEMLEALRNLILESDIQILMDVRLHPATKKVFDQAKIAVKKATGEK